MWREAEREKKSDEIVFFLRRAKSLPPNFPSSSFIELKTSNYAKRLAARTREGPNCPRERERSFNSGLVDMRS